MYAHSLSGRPASEWEPLSRHLDEVSRIAASFAAAFGAEDWGRLAGAWHDVGKYSDAFQQYLLRSADPDAGEEDQVAGRVDHSTFGAQHAARMLGGHAGRILAFCIAGHHAGLPDGSSDDETTRRRTLEARLKAGPPRVPPVQLPPDAQPSSKLRMPFALSPADAGFQVAFFTRMLFSCLIDADRSATEAFCNPERSDERNQTKPGIDDLLPALDAYLSKKQAEAEATPVNRLRAEVLSDCLTGAKLERGFFSLNVPTGGGKTFSSLAFALHHAREFALRRVVVAIPFTSIIEQTADEYRKALGVLSERGLLEHHSNIEPKKNSRSNALAAENWDAPLIVTTNVQLFESLFASGTTPCRKLHRLANSVIVLDEAQTIPVELLRPTLAALQELVRHYGCTVVLCTATQPALERREGFEIGLEGVRPIVSDVSSLFERLERVEVVQLGRVTDDDLASQLAAVSQVLCIVNSRPHASRLHEEVMRLTGKEGSYHLSTFMCAEHRREKLVEIRKRLKENKTCRLVSTQLVEAGVDIDFPVVYRAPAGFDSIAQAAGRCNREGRLKRGRAFLFETESPPPPGLLRHAVQAARELMPIFPNPLRPEAVEAYFRHFYWTQAHAWDKHEVMEALTDNLRRPELLLKFRRAAKHYRIIRDEQTSILVPHNGAARRIRDRLLRTSESDFQLLRMAQPYLVGVWPNTLAALVAQGLLLEHDSGLYLLLNEKAYSPEKGLQLDAAGIDPAVFIQ